MRRFSLIVYTARRPQCIFLDDIARVPAKDKETNDLRPYERGYNVGHESDESQPGNLKYFNTWV